MREAPAIVTGFSGILTGDEHPLTLRAGASVVC